LFAGHNAGFVGLGVAELLDVELDGKATDVPMGLTNDEVARVVGVILLWEVVVCDDVAILLVLLALVVDLVDDPDEVLLLLDEELALADDVEVPGEPVLELLGTAVPGLLTLVELLDVDVDVDDAGGAKVVDVNGEALAEELPTLF
jgi:hypothetical protein